MLAQAANSDFFRLVERIDPDFLGAIGMVAMVLSFVLAIVTVVTVFRTIQKIYLAKNQSRMINDLLAKGFSVDEIQQLMQGSKRNVMFRFFDNTRQAYVNRRPSPPVKESNA